jgi:hypothetical protein
MSRRVVVDQDPVRADAAPVAGEIDDAVDQRAWGPSLKAVVAIA